MRKDSHEKDKYAAATDINAAVACHRGLFTLFIFLLFPLISSQSSNFTLQAQRVTDYVDPRIGSEGLGRAFIGPCLPFGMAKPSPDCGTGNNAGWAKMPAAVSGFSQTHVSGTGGGPKYGNILVRPFKGDDQHRASEEIELGKYTCTFEESGIKAEVTAARHTSFYRFTYPQGVDPYYEIDLTHFLGRNPVPKAREAQQFEKADQHRLSETEVAGHQTISGGWNNGAPYTVYFYAESGPSLSASRHLPQRGETGAQTLLLKVGISFISEEQAKVNCHADLPNWNFEATHQHCLDEWDDILSRIPIQDEANEKVKRMYYTALYHTCLMPTDREEVGVDGPIYYDDYYAIWDTYRTSTPLLTLLAPERATAIAQSLLTIYQRDGFLPDARSGNSNGRTQGGSNAEIVLCDALARGLNIDADLALEAMLKDATVVPEDDEAEGRGGLEEYNHFHYIPYIINTDSGYQRIARAGNRTVEYAFCDWAIAQVAKHIYEQSNETDSSRFTGKQLKSIYDKYTQQSRRWRNLWRPDYEHDGARGFIMPRDTAGNWIDRLPFGHSKAQPLTFRYTPDVSYEGPWYCKWWDCFMYEASSWEYSFSIPHDIPGLIDLCGGPKAFEARLDTFFAHGYYNVANEPSFLTPLLYHWIDKPEKSTALIRKIIEENFSDQPDGLPGNDDGGAMSSWLACHLLGMYPLAGTDKWIEYEPINELRSLTTAHDLPHASPIFSQRTKVERNSISSEKPFTVTYSLHGQTRRFKMAFTPSGKGMRLDWEIERNLKLWHGSYTISAKALKSGSTLNYEQPLDGQHIVLPSNETFLLLSQKALSEVNRKGVCKFCNKQWMLDVDSRNADPTVLHLIDQAEGAEMWVDNHPELPLIRKMMNNPVEIDWEVKE